MNKLVWAIGLSLICALTAYAQKVETRATSSAASDAAVTTSKDRKTLNIASGTRLAGELQNTINVQKAAVGDQVVLKTTQAIKTGGRTVVNKGARMFGHVTEVAQKTKANGESRVSILFDRLQSSSLEIPIAASITSIVGATSHVSDGDVLSTNSSSNASSQSTVQRSPSSSSQSNGSLLGGATSSVSGAVNGTTSTVGDLVGSTTTSLGATVDGTANTTRAATSGLGRSLSDIQISESTSTEAAGASTLSLRGDNLRLEKGTTFILVLTQSASTTTSQTQ
jgi:hypothetical protein